MLICHFFFFAILQPIPNADFIVPVEIDGTVHQVYVLKRPHVDEFLKKMGGLYECVLFTASLAKYADPVADLLDQYVSLLHFHTRSICVCMQRCRILIRPFFFKFYLFIFILTGGMCFERVCSESRVCIIWVITLRI